MNVFPSALIAGVVGTLVLSTIITAATEMGLTRVDLPFLLGTTVTEDRRRAKAFGYLFHLLLGIAFALGYAAFFVVVGWSSWRLGALGGVLHALFSSTVL